MKKKVKKYNFQGEYNAFYAFLERKDYVLARGVLKDWNNEILTLLDLEREMFKDYRNPS